MNKIVVTNIQRLCVNDGPGVRTVVFLKGCTLQCPWCCNPEAIHIAKDIVFDKHICTYPKKKLFCIECERFEGERPVIECPIHAFEATYQRYSTEELLKILWKDELTFSSGGVTFSGGEPLLQIEALLPVLQALKSRNVHVTFETALYVPMEYVKMALAYVDYWLVDVKFQLGYFTNNEYNVPSDAVYKNLQKLQNAVVTTHIKYRMVYMHEAKERVREITQQLKDNNINNVEILECHSMATNKYSQLGKTFRRFSAPTEDDIKVLTQSLDNNNIQSQYLKI